MPTNNDQNAIRLVIQETILAIAYCCTRGMAVAQLCNHLLSALYSPIEISNIVHRNFKKLYLKLVCKNVLQGKFRNSFELKSRLAPSGSFYPGLYKKV